MSRVLPGGRERWGDVRKWKEPQGLGAEVGGGGWAGSDLEKVIYFFFFFLSFFLF